MKRNYPVIWWRKEAGTVSTVIVHLQIVTGYERTNHLKSSSSRVMTKCRWTLFITSSIYLNRYQKKKQDTCRLSPCDKFVFQKIKNLKASIFSSFFKQKQKDEKQEIVLILLYYTCCFVFSLFGLTVRLYNKYNKYTSISSSVTV